MRLVWSGLYLLTNLPVALVSYVILTGVIIGPYEGYCVNGSIVSDFGTVYDLGISASVFASFLVIGLCALKFLRWRSTFGYIWRYVLTCVVFGISMSVIGWLWIDSIRNSYPMGSFHEFCFNDTRLARTFRELNFITLLFGGVASGLLAGLSLALPSRCIILLWDRNAMNAVSGGNPVREMRHAGTDGAWPYS